MQTTSLRDSGLFRFGSVVAVLFAGCSAVDPLDAAGVGITPPSGWQADSGRLIPVPGERLAGWAGPDGSLSVYRTLPVPGGTARALAMESTTRQENLPEWRIVSATTAKLADREASRVEVVAPGDGRSLAPTGLGHPMYESGIAPRATRRISLGLPRASDTLWIVWHEPADATDPSAFDAVVRSVSLRD